MKESTAGLFVFARDVSVHDRCPSPCRLATLRSIFLRKSSTSVFCLLDSRTTTEAAAPPTHLLCGAVSTWSSLPPSVPSEEPSSSSSKGSPFLRTTYAYHGVACVPCYRHARLHFATEPPSRKKKPLISAVAFSTRVAGLRVYNIAVHQYLDAQRASEFLGMSRQSARLPMTLEMLFTTCRDACTKPR